MTVWILAGITAALHITLAVLLRRTRTLQTQQRNELAVLASQTTAALQDLNDRLNHILMTDEERKLLSLPLGGEIGREVLLRATDDFKTRALEAAQQALEAESGTCPPHQWGKVKYGTPRRFTNMLEIEHLGEQKMYLRVCKKCDERQASTEQRGGHWNDD